MSLREIREMYRYLLIGAILGGALFDWPDALMIGLTIALLGLMVIHDEESR